MFCQTLTLYDTDLDTDNADTDHTQLLVNQYQDLLVSVSPLLGVHNLMVAMEMLVLIFMMLVNLILMVIMVQRIILSGL